MSRRILIIEDEATMRLLLRDFFETVGYQVMDAADGRTALDLAASEPFGLAFVDINLPDITGDEVMRRMRNSGVSAELVVLSGNLRESYQDRIADLRVREVLEKPVDLCVLKDLAEQVLGRADAV